MTESERGSVGIHAALVRGMGKGYQHIFENRRQRRAAEDNRDEERPLSGIPGTAPLAVKLRALGIP